MSVRNYYCPERQRSEKKHHFSFYWWHKEERFHSRVRSGLKCRRCDGDNLTRLVAGDWRCRRVRKISPRYLNRRRALVLYEYINISFMNATARIFYKTLFHFSIFKGVRKKDGGVTSFSYSRRTLNNYLKTWNLFRSGHLLSPVSMTTRLGLNSRK